MTDKPRVEPSVSEPARPMWCFMCNEYYDDKRDKCPDCGAKLVDRSPVIAPQPTPEPPMCECGHSDEFHDDGRLSCTHQRTPNLMCSCMKFEPVIAPQLTPEPLLWDELERATELRAKIVRALFDRHERRLGGYSHGEPTQAELDTAWASDGKTRGLYLDGFVDTIRAIRETLTSEAAPQGVGKLSPEPACCPTCESSDQRVHPIVDSGGICTDKWHTLNPKGVEGAGKTAREFIEAAYEKWMEKEFGKHWYAAKNINDKQVAIQFCESETLTLRAELQQANARLKGMTADRDYWKERYHAK